MATDQTRLLLLDELLYSRLDNELDSLDLLEWRKPQRWLRVLAKRQCANNSSRWWRKSDAASAKPSPSTGSVNLNPKRGACNEPFSRSTRTSIGTATDLNSLKRRPVAYYDPSAELGPNRRSLPIHPTTEEACCLMLLKTSFNKRNSSLRTFQMNSPTWR